MTWLHGRCETCCCKCVDRDDSDVDCGGELQNLQGQIVFTADLTEVNNSADTVDEDICIGGAGFAYECTGATSTPLANHVKVNCIVYGCLFMKLTLSNFSGSLSGMGSSLSALGKSDLRLILTGNIAGTAAICSSQTPRASHNVAFPTVEPINYKQLLSPGGRQGFYLDGKLWRVSLTGNSAGSLVIFNDASFRLRLNIGNKTESGTNFECSASGSGIADIFDETLTGQTFNRINMSWTFSDCDVAFESTYNNDLNCCTTLNNIHCVTPTVDAYSGPIPSDCTTSPNDEYECGQC